MRTLQYESLSFRELGQRANQEDSIYPEGHQQSNGLFILCDGMGGHEKGEVASETICTALSRVVPRVGALNEKAFRKALTEACDALDKKNDDSDGSKKMGTTLAFLKIHEAGALIAHVGDSRVYHIRPSEGRIIHVTRDHSLVNDLVSIGELTPEEARHSPQKNVITRVLQPGNHGRADIFNDVDIRPGDWFYLCSDGMLEEMEDEEIVRIFSAPTTISEKAAYLRERTSENRDNHSAHLVHILGEAPVHPAEKSSRSVFRNPRYWVMVAALSLLTFLAVFGVYYWGSSRKSAEPVQPPEAETVTGQPLDQSPEKPLSEADTLSVKEEGK